MGAVSYLPDSPRSALLRTRLIETIYATVADPDKWQTLIAELVAGTNSRSARLLVMNADASRVISSIKHNIDDNFHSQYVKHYVNACPWRPELARKRPGRLYSTYLHFSCRQPDFMRSEFYNDWARHQDIHHGVCGTIYQDSRQTVQLLVQRTRGQGHYTETDTAFFNEYVPHLRHAFQLADQVADRRSRAEAIALAADSEHLPFILLDYSLRPVHCNSSAEALINSESVLLLTRGQLRLAEREQDQQFQRLLRTCLAAADSRTLHAACDPLEVPRPDQSTLQLWVKSVHPDVPTLAGKASGYVAVYIYDPEVRILLDHDRLCKIYGLSKAEIRVAMALLATPDLADVARRCFISLHTVRSHLKAIFAKTATQNQADLVKRLMVGPARRR